MKNLTWKGVCSVTKIKEVKYPKGIKVVKKEMEKLEKKHITREKLIRKWYALIKPT